MRNVLVGSRFFGSEIYRGLGMYCERSRAEVLGKFTAIMSEIDFFAEAMKWPDLKLQIEQGLDVLTTLVFVAYFVTEAEWLRDAATKIASSPGL